MAALDHLLTHPALDLSLSEREAYEQAAQGLRQLLPRMIELLRPKKELVKESRKRKHRKKKK